MGRRSTKLAGPSRVWANDRSDRTRMSLDGRQAPPTGPLWPTAEQHIPVVWPRTSGVRRTAARRPLVAYTSTRPTPEIRHPRWTTVKQPLAGRISAALAWPYRLSHGSEDADRRVARPRRDALHWRGLGRCAQQSRRLSHRKFKAPGKTLQRLILYQHRHRGRMPGCVPSS